MIGDTSNLLLSSVNLFTFLILKFHSSPPFFCSSRPREQRYLVRWASSQLYDINALSRMVDPSLDGKLPMKSLSWFADIINRCIQVICFLIPFIHRMDIEQFISYEIFSCRRFSDHLESICIIF